MLEALRRYYAAKKILATKFECSHKAVCENGNSEFVGPAAAFVSTGYESRTLPRLLILSLDGGSRDDDDPEARLPLSMRNWEKCRDILNKEKFPRRRHWFRTHELAWCILRRFDRQLQFADVNKYFAHANAAKCCENHPDRKVARDILFENCREFLPGELDILSPDILVTQGEKAEAAILRSPASYEILDIEQYSSKKTGVSANSDDGDEDWYVAYASSRYLRTLRGLAGNQEHDVLWLHTHHPTPPPRSRGYYRFLRQIDIDRTKAFGHPHRCRGWNRYGDIIADWWEQEHGDLKP